jgi:hypothetical protein
MLEASNGAARETGICSTSQITTMPNRSRSTTKEKTYLDPADCTLTNTLVSGGSQVFTPSDFGVEIGGRPTFENLPRSADLPHGPIRKQSPEERRRGGSHTTFNEIVASVKTGNIAKLTERVDAANALAGIVRGRARDVCHKVRDRAISALLKHGTHRAGKRRTV